MTRFCADQPRLPSSFGRRRTKGLTGGSRYPLSRGMTPMVNALPPRSGEALVEDDGETPDFVKCVVQGNRRYAENVRRPDVTDYSSICQRLKQRLGAAANYQRK